MRALLRSCVHVSSCPACGAGFYCVNAVRTAITVGFYGLPESTPSLYTSQAPCSPGAYCVANGTKILCPVGRYGELAATTVSQYSSLVAVVGARAWLLTTAPFVLYTFFCIRCCQGMPPARRLRSAPTCAPRGTRAILAPLPPRSVVRRTRIVLATVSGTPCRLGRTPPPRLSPPQCGQATHGATLGSTVSQAFGILAALDGMAAPQTQRPVTALGSAVQGTSAPAPTTPARLHSRAATPRCFAPRAPHCPPRCCRGITRLGARQQPPKPPKSSVRREATASRV